MNTPAMPTTLAALAAAAPGYTPTDLRVDIARRIILAAVTPLAGDEPVPLRAALGRVLAEDLRSPVNVPPGDNSAMDGFALRADDLSNDGVTTLVEVGVSLAGRPFAGSVAAGQCVRIMTGAFLPAGADTVVMKEIVRADASDRGRAHFPPGQSRGQNVRCAGEDIAKGDTALTRGTRLGAAELGLLASLGLGAVSCRPRLRVALFSSGDELRDAGEPAGHGQRYDSNRHSLAALLARLSCAVTDLGIVPDDPAQIEARMTQAAACADMVITSGGVSVGDADYTGAIMAKLGEVLDWKLAMRPGRPLAFGRIHAGDRAAWIFGLPGNPVAAMIAFMQFVEPALLKLAGAAARSAPLVLAKSATPIRKRPGRTEFARGTLSATGEGMLVEAAANQGSGILRLMAEANCLIVLEHERGDVAAGEHVPVQLFAGLF
ncbi:MAG: molybdopterin molybdenumtransferase MoeA [Betaproteobacteria bacterium]|nr:molybdopterin molybdenumtransferase MoeA [Betaproteobacteria bacterium]